MIYPKAISSILPVTGHTDFVGAGSTYVVIKGAKLNGSQFIPLALQKGANKIVIQDDHVLDETILNLIKDYNAQLIKVHDCRQALSELSAKAFDYPAKKLKILGVTGTKGKTTSVFLTHHILRSSGYKTAMISGVKNIINGQDYESCLTTPLPDYLHAFFDKCVKENVEYVVMESSAQAFSLRRLYDIEFAGIIFTNLDLEHMEFYSSMQEYFDAKCQILKQVKNNSPVIINIDNKWTQQIDFKNKHYSSVSLENKNASFFAQIQSNDFAGLNLKIKTENNIYEFKSNLIGNFNAYNISGVIALCLKLGINSEQVKIGLESFERVPGRMQGYQLNNGSHVFIDYAHNPSSFENVLQTIKPLARKLIVVFGAGGDRDKLKRPLMGKITSEIADNVILTSDNPRSENAHDIIDQIILGISNENKNKIYCDIDRAKAIEYAYNISKSGDVIAILGKGPDEYQIFGDQKTYFSDTKTILDLQSKF